MPPNTVGQPLPCVEHAISVSLPTWADTIAYKNCEELVLKRMQTGYPRYFIHMSIRRLVALFEQSFGSKGEMALPLRSLHAAKACLEFINERSISGSARILECPSLHLNAEFQVHVVFFPAKSFGVAKEFWQNTGLGVSSRMAEKYLSLFNTRRGLSFTTPVDVPPEHPNHLFVAQEVCRPSSSAKHTLRSRISSLLAMGMEKKTREVDEGYRMPSYKLTENDVFLYPTGMTAIWSAHQLCMDVFGRRRSICFGFPYADTLKILEKWGPGCYFFADGEEASIDQLEILLSNLTITSPAEPPVLSLFTEFPSNPLLHSVNLTRLRSLADKYNFLVIIDETIGNFANVRVLPFADIVVTSLSKLFSGSANVMGGSLVLNPAGKHYLKLKAHLDRTFEDTYFDADAEIMEVNSRNFLHRSAIINENAEAVCDYLRSCSPVITRVYYPKWQSTLNFDKCRISGHGGLFSLLFASPTAAQAFFDALDCSKGPSLGTNFTLACPYAIFAHFGELDWAAEHGVPVELVRVSVGVEGKENILHIFQRAVKRAEEAHTLVSPSPGASFIVDGIL